MSFPSADRFPRVIGETAASTDPVGTHLGRVSRVPLGLAFCALLVYAAMILSIGVAADWRLLHEDNGAEQTTLALGHVRLGLAQTRAHDVFFNPQTGEATVYGHHPPGTALILAGAFALTGSDSPQVARMVPISFQLGSLVLLVTLLLRIFSRGTALLGGFFMATLPMSSYFGRMVNYEPLCLFAIFVQLNGYADFKRNRTVRGLAWLFFGIALGGLIDWASFFFAAAIAAAEAVDVLKRRSRPASLIAPVAAGIGILLFDLWHLWYAGHGTLAPLREVVFRGSQAGHPNVRLGPFIGSQLETFRRYFTHAGLFSSALVAVGLARSRTALSKNLFDPGDRMLLRRLVVVTGAAAVGYVLSAPWWAKVHPYWQFYFLPYVVLSMVIVFRWMSRRTRERSTPASRALLAVFVLEVVLTSAYMLHLRHTRPGAYAVKQTARFRETYLSPAHLGNRKSSR